MSERLGIRSGGYKRAANIGQIFHLLHCARYRGKTEAELLGILETLRGDVIASIREWIASGKAPIAVKNAEAEAEQDIGMARMMSELFSRKFPIENPRFRTLGTELELQGKDADGRLDLLLEETGVRQGLVIVDNKTISTTSDLWVKAAGYSWQGAIYRRIVETAYPDRPVLGMLYNLCRKPTCKWKKAQSYEQYLAECLGWYEGTADPEGDWDWTKNRNQPDGPWRPMAQYFVPFPKEESEEVSTIVEEVARAGVALPLLDLFPRTGEATGACRNHYGRFCEMLPFCELGPQNWQKVFETGNWTTKEADGLGSLPEDYE